MNWIKCSDKLPLDNGAKLIFCVPAKGYKQQQTKSTFIASYCVCSGWNEVVSNPEMNGQQRRYWDHLLKYEITHWAEIDFPTNDRMSDERIKSISETSSDGVLGST